LANRLTDAQDPDSHYAYAYDGVNRVTQVTNNLGPSGSGVSGFILTQGYNGFNDRTSLSDSQYGVISYTYDAAHRLTNASLSVAGTQGPQVTLGYDPLNRLTSILRQVSSSGPSVSSTIAYDNANRVTTISHSSSQAGTLATYSYSQ